MSGCQWPAGYIYIGSNHRNGIDISIMADFPWDSVKIYPPIGIARVGNSFLNYEEGWFYGPEIPGYFEEPKDGFKDLFGSVKRQVLFSDLSEGLYYLKLDSTYYRLLVSESMALQKMERTSAKSTSPPDMTSNGRFNW